MRRLCFCRCVTGPDSTRHITDKTVPHGSKRGVSVVADVQEVFACAGHAVTEKHEQEHEPASAEPVIQKHEQEHEPAAAEPVVEKHAPQRTKDGIISPLSHRTHRHEIHVVHGSKTGTACRAQEGTHSGSSTTGPQRAEAQTLPYLHHHRKRLPSSTPARTCQG